MATRGYVCNQCGATLQMERTPFSFYSLVGTHDHSIKAHQRNFWGHCPQHGRRMAHIVGNHDTHQESRMRRWFPKRVWGRVKAGLSAEDRRKFTRALHGKYQPSSQDLATWSAIAFSGMPKEGASILKGGPLGH